MEVAREEVEGGESLGEWVRAMRPYTFKADTVIVHPLIFEEIERLKDRSKVEVFVDRIRWLPWTVWEWLDWHWRWDVARNARKALITVEDLWYRWIEGESDEHDE